MRNLRNKCLFILLILNVFLLSSCSRNMDYYNNKGILAGLHIKKFDYGNGASGVLFAVELKNTKDSSSCLLLTGKIRSSIDTTLFSQSIYDCILEIRQNDIVKRSTELSKIGKASLDGAMLNIHILKKDSSEFVNIRYWGDLKKYFKLNNSKCFVRLLLLPQANNIALLRRMYGDQYFEKTKDIKLLLDTIKTPFVKL